MSDETRPATDEERLDALFDSLSHVTRRRLVGILDRFGEPVALADAAEAVATASDDVTIQDRTAEEIRDVYMSLYHAHVPKLADVGAVSYHQERDLVVLTERGERLAAILESVSEALGERTAV